MNYTLENFISYCDDMMIATEAISFSEIKAGIVKMFVKLVNLIESHVRKMKDSKVKSVLMRLLGRAKQGLSKSKTLKENDKYKAQELSKEAKDIKQEYEKVKEPTNENIKNVKLTKSTHTKTNNKVNDIHKRQSFNDFGRPNKQMQRQEMFEEFEIEEFKIEEFEPEYFEFEEFKIEEFEPEYFEF